MPLQNIYFLFYINKDEEINQRKELIYVDKLLNQSTIESCNDIFQSSEIVNNTVRNLADILSRYLPIKDDSDIRRADC